VTSSLNSTVTLCEGCRDDGHVEELTLGIIQLAVSTRPFQPFSHTHTHTHTHTPNL